MKMQRVTVTLDTKRFAALRRISKQEGRSVSWLVRQGLQELLKKQK